MSRPLVNQAACRPTLYCFISMLDYKDAQSNYFPVLNHDKLQRSTMPQGTPYIPSDLGLNVGDSKGLIVIKQAYCYPVLY